MPSSNASRNSRQNSGGEAPAEPELSYDEVIAAADLAQAAQGADEDPELVLTVFGNRLKRKRSELIAAYDLDGLDNDRIIKIAPRPKQAADQQLARPKHPKRRRWP